MGRNSEVKDFQSEQIVAALRQEASEYDNSLEYVIALTHRYSSDGIHTKLLIPLSECIEPIGWSLEQEDELPTSSSFYKGGILGLRAIEGAGGVRLFKRVQEQNMVVVDGRRLVSGDAQAIHRFAETLLYFGQEGFARVPAYHEMFEKWEDVLVPNVRHQRYLRCGFGVFAMMAQKAIVDVQTEELEQMAKEAPDHDWSTELEGLTDRE